MQTTQKLLKFARLLVGVVGESTPALDAANEFVRLVLTEEQIKLPGGVYARVSKLGGAHRPSVSLTLAFDPKMNGLTEF